VTRVLVTGGGGFIGSHLVSRLAAEGYEVRVLDNFATGRRENLTDLDSDVELVEGDLQSYERVHTAVRACEVVFHQGALPSVPRSVQDPLTTNAVNVVGTLNVLLASRDSGVRRIVFASSSSVYGATPELPKREDLPVAPISPYAVTKLAGESYCRSFSEVYGLETVTLRCFNVFGPRQDPLSQYAAVIPRFIEAGLGGAELTIYGDGEQSRDFTYIDNVIEANILAMRPASAAGQVFNAAGGERITLNRLVKELGAIMGTELAARHIAPRAGEVRHSLADLSRAAEGLGYKPTVSFAEGLARAVAYFREQAGVRSRAAPATTSR
jgi:nucleoside-diphosphate-sugar epimerase